MVLRFNLLILLSFVVSFGIGQNSLEFSHEPITERYSVLELNVEADYFSEAIQNSLISNLAFGGAIDRASLVDMESSMNGENTFGGWASAGIRYRALSDSIGFKSSNSLFLEFGTARYGYATFPKDIFHLGFIGNADKLGETLQMSHASAEYMNYQYAGLGIMNESTGSYFSFNLINVQSYFSSEVEEFTLFTAEDASELELTYSGSVTMNDTLRGDFLSNSGTGFTLNGRYNFKVRENKDLVSLELRNLGAAILNDRTRSLKADSTWNFSGVNIDDVFSSDNPLSSITLQDSLAYSDDQKAKNVLMPLDINAAYFHRINKSDHFGFSVRKRFFTDHRAEIGVNYLHNETNRIGYNVGLSYGGYGRLRMNAGAHLSLENWKFYISTRNLVGAFLESGSGRSASFGIARKFRTAS